MPRTREVDAAKFERQQRERRHWTPGTLDKRRPCTVCGITLPKVISATHSTHPTCDPDPRVREEMSHA